MQKKTITVILTALFWGLIWFSPAYADGIIVPDPPVCGSELCPPPPCADIFPCPTPSPMSQLVIRYHRVSVDIKDQLATTHVDQVFFNPNDWPVEGTYIFPLPQGAVVTSFTLWVDGEAVMGKILEANEARMIYETIVSQMRDPALLEYVDRGAVQAHVFPIPPGGERRIELEYSQILVAENGLARYVYPLNTEKFSLWPLESVVIEASISSTQEPIRAVYSPSHVVDVQQKDAHHADAYYEALNVLPDQDFVLYYSLGDQMGIHLLTYQDPAEPGEGGYFLMMLAPQIPQMDEIQAKDLILVLDRSGSMEGEKFQQVQQAMSFILDHLNPDDRFNILAFSSSVDAYASRLNSAAEAGSAIQWIQRLRAQGSTDIQRVLLEAFSYLDPERPSYVIFLTDGLATKGETDPQRIIDTLAEATPRNVNLFTFGVGYDVDTYLLDSLAQSHHGRSTYVRPGEQLDEILSGFYAQVSSPLLTGLEVDFGGAPVYDLYPATLPDLFAGSQLIITGRFRRAVKTDITLRGISNQNPQRYTYPQQDFAAHGDDLENQALIPRLWATRKVGYLLNRVRLQGPDQETIDQIVQLSIRYGIVTPYTSYLVTEDTPVGVDEQARIAGEAMKAFETLAGAPTSGEAAVERAAGEGELTQSDAVLESPHGEAANRIRYVGSRTFFFSDGIWVDTGYDPQEMTRVDVPFMSQKYLDLIRRKAELAAAFALGQRVIALSDGIAYEVSYENAAVQSSTLLATPIGQPGMVTEQPPTRTPTPLTPASSSSVSTARSQVNTLCGGGAILIALAGWMAIKKKMRTYPG